MRACGSDPLLNGGIDSFLLHNQRLSQMLGPLVVNLSLLGAVDVAWTEACSVAIVVQDFESITRYTYCFLEVY